MCIIAYVNKGKDLTDERIRYMFSGNPDGAGLMWKPTNSSEVEIRKGFMTVEALIRAYRKIPKSCERAIHMRIATAGKVSVDCCHPFPIRKNVELMRKPVDRTDVALMHNGIISYCQPKGGIQATYSDSMKFAAEYIYGFKDLLDDYRVQTLLEESTTSRLLIMRKGKPTILLGDWKEEDGVKFSNSNYKAKPYTDWGYGTHCYNYGYDYSSNPYSCTATPKTTVKKKPYVVNNDANWEHPVRFVLDVSDYVDECVKNGFSMGDIDGDVQDEIALEIDEEPYATAPIVNDMYWGDDFNTVILETFGIPENTKYIGMFKVVRSSVIAD